MGVTLKPVAVGQNGAVSAANINESQENLNEAVMPTGGGVGDVLVKIDGADYNVVWTTPAAPILETSVLLENGLTGNISIGDTSVSRVIRIDYSIVRGSLLETGRLTITNVAGTLINIQSTSNDKAKIKLTKDIDGADIRLHWDDSIDPDGNDSTIYMQIVKETI